MGISMLGADLFEGLNKIIGGIGNIVMKALLAILGPLVEILVSIIMGLFSYLFYIISTFLLALIDFVELLFRLLAGLDVEGMHMSYKGGEGDLLVQIIRSEEVTQAFLAVAIVGVFLLIITTVFQMIRVEYTTEGSKNAKGPILEKAFRGLCNLMLIPILSIFGILIGNEILQLLDTATSGAEGASISGQLWVTAASDAYYTTEEDREKYKIDEDEVLNPIVPIINMAVDSGTKKANDLLDNKTTEIKSEKIEMENEKVRNGFLTGEDGYDLYNIVEVTDYYNITKINYFMLIFGACIIIKTLYHAAFGMVNRLYRCIAYFIVSPIAVGMTPINEGNMGTWRKKFLGLVISAYGVIVSLNLFFVITEILMNVSFTFDSANLGGFTQILGTYAMEGLIKCIFIIVGALMIEKLSGDFVGYFGGEDALSAGKGLAGETTQMATKAISTAVTGAAVIGTGGAAAMGLAGKLGKGVGGMISAGRTGGAKAVGKFVGGGFKNMGVKALDGLKRTGSKLYQTTGLADIGDIVHEQQLIGMEKDLDKLGVGSTESLKSEYDTMIRSDEYRGLSRDEKRRRSSEYNEKMKLAKARDKMQDKINEDRKAAALRADKRIDGTAGIGHILGSAWNNSVIGKGAKTGLDNWSKHKSEGTSMSEQGKKSHDNVEQAKKKQKEEAFDRLHASDIEFKNRQQILLKTTQLRDEQLLKTKEYRDQKGKNDTKITNFEELSQLLMKAKINPNTLTETEKARLVIGADGKYSRVKDSNGMTYSEDNLADKINDLRKENEDLEIKLKLEKFDLSGIIREAFSKNLDDKKLESLIVKAMEQQGEEGNKKVLDAIKQLLTDVMSKDGGSK